MYWWLAVVYCRWQIKISLAYWSEKITRTIASAKFFAKAFFCWSGQSLVLNKSVKEGGVRGGDEVNLTVQKSKPRRTDGPTDRVTYRAANTQLTSRFLTSERRGWIWGWINVMMVLMLGNSELNSARIPRQSESVGSRRVHDQRRNVRSGFVAAVYDWLINWLIDWLIDWEFMIRVDTF